MSTDSAARPSLTRLGQIAIRVHDVERAKVFYRDVLGMKHLFDGGPKLTFFDCGGVRLMLSLPEAPEFDHPASICYYSVPDITAMAAALRAQGVHFEDEPHVVAELPTIRIWMTHFRDPDGNLLVLMSEVERTGA